MSKLMRGMAILALAAVPGSLVAQGPPAGGQGRMGPRGMGPRDPVAVVLAAKDSLKLTNAQVKQLEQIQSQLKEKNAPLIAQIDAKRPQRPAEGRATPPTDEQRQQWRQAMQELRPVLEQVRTNNREAMTEAFKVLTPDQQTAARERMRARRGGMGGRGMRGGRGQGGRDGWRNGAGSGRG